MKFDTAVINEKEAQFIDDKITPFNRNHPAFTQNGDFVSLNFHIKDKDGFLTAQINSFMYCWGMLYVDVLLVEENHRGGQLGSFLLNKFEAEAKSMGATLSHLEAFDWRAKDFYIKHGYEIFGILEGCHPKHKRCCMKKVLGE